MQDPQRGIWQKRHLAQQKQQLQEAVDCDEHTPLPLDERPLLFEIRGLLQVCSEQVAVTRRA